jgi:hypothetical protein
LLQKLIQKSLRNERLETFGKNFEMQHTLLCTFEPKLEIYQFHQEEMLAKLLFDLVLQYS